MEFETQYISVCLVLLYKVLHTLDIFANSLFVL